jgi:N-methylhydantoinase A
VHEVFVEVPNKVLEADDVDALVDRFQEKYERLYGKGSALRGSGVEFTTLRTEVTLPVLKPRPTPVEPARGKPQPIAVRRVYFYRAGFQEATVYRSSDLGAGHVIAGPAIIERPDTTVVVGMGQSLEIERYGNMILRPAVKGAH